MKNKRGKQYIVVLLVLLVAVTSFIYIFLSKDKGENKESYLDQPEYEQLLKSAIAEADKELQRQGSEEEVFIVTREMAENPKYQNANGTLNMDAIQTDLGIPIKPSPEGALKEKRFSAIDGIIEPHVLGAAQVGIYSNADGNAWKLKKGTTMRFHVYVDTAYYNAAGQIYFGTLKEGESFLIDNLGSGHEADQDIEFTYTTDESNNYQFYLFRGSMEPIIIKGIEITQ